MHGVAFVLLLVFFFIEQKYQIFMAFILWAFFCFQFLLLRPGTFGRLLFCFASFFPSLTKRIYGVYCVCFCCCVCYLLIFYVYVTNLNAEFSIHTDSHAIPTPHQPWSREKPILNSMHVCSFRSLYQFIAIRTSNPCQFFQLK